MAKLPGKPITNKQRMMGAFLSFRHEGKTKYVKLGPADSTEFTPNITEVESWSNEFGDRRLIGTFPTQKDGTVVINGLQMWHEFAYQSLFMSELKYLTQTAATAVPFTIEDVAVGDRIRIDAIKATNIDLSVGATALVEDTHFLFHAKTGFLEIIALPVDATGDAEGTYDKPAITEADKLLDLSIMETSGVRGELSVVGVIQGGPGEEVEMILKDVKFLPNGAISSGDTANLNTWSITGRVYSTAEHGYGYLRGLEAIA